MKSLTQIKKAKTLKTIKKTELKKVKGGTKEYGGQQPDIFVI